MEKQHTVLCVDDEPFVVASLARLLRHDYNVLTATSGEEALRILTQQRVDVLVSDQRMPGMKGVDLLRRVKDTYPATMRILLTGYADLNAIVDSVNEGEVFRYITKPWKNEVLRYTVSIAAKAAMESSEEAARIASRPSVALDISSGDPTKDVELVDVLVIDTDVGFHELVRRACSHKGRLFHAASMEDALRILEHAPTIGVIISETRVGQEDVTDLVTTLKAYHPSITTIVASSYTDANVVIKLINEGQIYRFLAKPTNEGRIEETVTRAGRMHKSLANSSQLVRRYQVDSAIAEDAPNAVLSQSPPPSMAQPNVAPNYAGPATEPMHANAPLPAQPYAPASATSADMYSPTPQCQAKGGLVSRIRALLFKKR